MLLPHLPKLAPSSARWYPSSSHIIFISFSSPTFIIYVYLSTSFSGSFSYLSLSLSLQPRSLSLFRHVNHPCLFLLLTLCTPFLSLSHVLAFLSLQPCSPPLFFSVVDNTSLILYLSPTISHTFLLSSVMLAHFTIFCCGHHVSLSFSPPPSLSLFYVHPTNHDMID